MGASIYYEDHPVWYHIALLKVFTLCSYGDKGVYLNEAKCQKAVPLNMLLSLLERLEDEKSYNYKYIKAIHIPLLEFFYHIYLDTERTNEELVSHSGFIAFLKRQNQKIETVEVVNAKNLAYFEWIFRIVAVFAETFLRTSEKNESSIIEHEDFFELKSFAVSFSQNIAKFKAVNFSLEAKSDLMKFCQRFSLNFMDINFISGGILRDEVKDEKSTKERWNTLSENLIYNSQMKKHLQEEKYQLLKLITEAETFEPQLNRKRILENLVQFLKLTYSKKVANSTVLQIIEIFQMLLFKDLNLSEKSDEEKLAKRQEEMNEFGLVKVCLGLLSEPGLNAKAFRALIRLSIRLLKGGNLNIQNEFILYFLNVQASEYFFERIEYYIRKETKVIMNGTLPPEVRHPCYGEAPQYTRFILRLLQLFCENHNKQLQNYIRHQTNSRLNHDMVSLTVALLAALMKKMHFRRFHLMSQCFDTLTEFIQGPCSENQISIIEGQFLDIAVNILSYNEQSNLLERYPSLQTDDTSAVAYDEEVLQENDQRTYLHGWMISHLKHKCMITLHSLLEGRSDNYVVTHMIRKFHLELLKANLLSYYENYERRYKPGYYYEDLFGHDEENDAFQYEKTDNPQDIDPQYYQIIIECPFLIYHLIRKFRDLNDPENRELFREELPDITQESDSSTLFGLKIFGDIGKLSLSLFNKGLQAVTILTKFTQFNRDENLEEEIQKQKMKVVYSFFESFTGNVEVMFNNSICKVYFPLPHFYPGLTIEAKDRFNNVVDRSSAKAKLNFLQQSIPEMMVVMEHEDRLQRFFSRHFLFAALTARPDFWGEFALLLTVLINIIILLSFSTYNTDRLSEYSLFYKASGNSDRGLSTAETHWLIQACALLHVISAGFVAAFFMIKEWPILAKKGGIRSLSYLKEGKPALTAVCTKAKGRFSH